MRVGIVGAGAIARIHATQWLKLPVHFAGCFDRHPERAAAFCAQFGGRAFATLDELLANIDLITICTPTEGHHAAVITAAKAGVAIICEKPIARHLRDGEEMIAACEAAGVPLFVAHVLRFFPVYAQAKRTLESGVIGAPGVIRTTRAGAHPQPGAYFSSHFYTDRERSGGAAIDLAIHDIDYQRWLAGDVERVFARGLTFAGKPYADQAHILLRFRSGAIGHIDANWALPLGVSHTSLEIAGNQGLIEWDSLQPAPMISAIYDSGQPAQLRQISTNAIAEYDDPYYAQLAHVLTCLKQKQPFMVTPNDALMALKCSLAARESMRSGLPIELDAYQELDI